MQRNAALSATQQVTRPRGLRGISPTVLISTVSMALLLVVSFSGLRALDAQQQASGAATALAVAEAALYRFEAATLRELLAVRAEEGVAAQQASRELLGALDLAAKRGGGPEQARARTLSEEAEQLAAAAERVRDLARRGDREAATHTFFETVQPRLQRLRMALAEDRRRSAAAAETPGLTPVADTPVHLALLLGGIAGLLACLFAAVMWYRQRQLRGTVLDGLSEALGRAGRYVNAFLASSQQYAAGTAHQTAAIEEMAITTEDLSTGARYVAQSAERAAQLTAGSQAAVQDTIARMEEVQEKVAAAVARITALGEQSRYVGAIADLISDIAGKTHLLSVNAAIEAVTAGPHGQRFAVVAGQVKDLAAETQEATAQVQRIVGEIRTATDALVAATQEAARVAEAGAVAAHRAGTAMEDVVQVVHTISNATRQQEAASQQVVQTMRDVVAVARQSAEVSRQAAVEAQRLKETADDLVRLVADLEHL